MLTADDIIRSMRLSQQCGTGGGSCFGVTDTSRLRPAFQRISPRFQEYRITFKAGNEINPDAQPHFFEAANDVDAKHIAGDVLEIKGKLTAERFHKAGAEAIFCGDKKIFPLKKEK